MVEGENKVRGMNFKSYFLPPNNEVYFNKLLRLLAPIFQVEVWKLLRFSPYYRIVTNIS